MSIPVEVGELAAAAADFDACYLLTTSDDGRPHATSAVIAIDGATVRCGLGRRTARNGRERNLVSLLWPPVEPGGYSLIVDGTLEVYGTPGDDARGEITATNAVLHRSAAAGPTNSADCESDCIPVEIGE